MYSKQQKETALKLFKETQSVSETVRILCYPTRKNLYNWIYEDVRTPVSSITYSYTSNSPSNPYVYAKADITIEDGTVYRIPQHKLTNAQ